jgi:release factor glutamine methyltransferase
MTIAELLEALTQRFARTGIAAARSDARWLVRHALGLSAAQLTLAASRPLTEAEVAAIRPLADRRAAREPLQLVLGGTNFRGHPLALRPGVFVPRPETELLVDLVLDGLPRGATVVEPCTGSGAVACAIAVERPDVTVLATDVDGLAVEVATANAVALQARVDVRTGWLLDPVPVTLCGRIAVLVANPPYLAED